MDQITLANYLIVLSTLLSPLIALQLQKIIEDWKDKRKRKHDIFNTLMITRNSTLDIRFVESLNLIQIEYHKSKTGKGREVLDAWSEYHSVLNDRNISVEQWHIRKSDLLVNLLYEMSKALGYDYNKVQLKAGYYPQFYVDQENHLNFIRSKLVEILSKEEGIPVVVKQEIKN